MNRVGPSGGDQRIFDPQSPGRDRGGGGRRDGVGTPPSAVFEETGSGSARAGQSRGVGRGPGDGGRLTKTNDAGG